LDRVEVDASCSFAPGQLGVAIGRAKEKKGLRVIGFNMSSILKHDQSLYTYYDDNADIMFDDNTGNCSCCKQHYTALNNHNAKFESIPEDELSDFSDGGNR